MSAVAASPDPLDDLQRVRTETADALLPVASREDALMMAVLIERALSPESRSALGTLLREADDLRINRRDVHRQLRRRALAVLSDVLEASPARFTAVVADVRGCHVTLLRTLRDRLRAVVEREGDA
jgi:hypothetical protein